MPQYHINNPNWGMRDLQGAALRHREGKREDMREAQNSQLNAMQMTNYQQNIDDRREKNALAKTLAEQQSEASDQKKKVDAAINLMNVPPEMRPEAFRAISIQNGWPVSEYTPELEKGLQALAISGGWTPEKPEYAIQDGQYVPKQPGGSAMPIPNYTPQKKEPLVSITNTAPEQEKEFSKKIGSGFGDDYLNMQRAAEATKMADAKWDRLGYLLKEAGSGPTRPLTAKAASIIQDLTGVNIDEGLPYAEASKMITNQLALAMRSTANGEGMPGQLSDRDVRFLLESFPSLSNNPEAVPLMVNWTKKLNKWKRDYAQKAREYKKNNNGQYDEYFQDDIRQWVEANPIFTTEDQKKIMTISGLPEGITEDDIRETMRANNMTREQVLSKLKGR